MRNLNSLITALVLSFSTLTAVGCATTGGDEYSEAEDEAAGAGKLTFWQTGSNFYFNLKSGNGAILMTSEAYTSRGGSIKGALSVLVNGVDPARYTVNKTATGYNVRLRAGNGETIAVSQVYTTKSSATRAITSAVRAVTSYLDKREAAVGARFEVLVGSTGLYRFNVRNKDGKTVMMSEHYTTEAAAFNGAFAVQSAGQNPANYNLKDNSAGGAYFTLQSGNGQIIGVSVQYADREQASAAMAALMTLLPSISAL
jgi:uncharacterized protein